MARFAGGNEQGTEQLIPGTPYLIMESKPFLSYTLFQSILKAGRPGLVLSRHHPSKLREMGLITIPNQIFWLSKVPGEGHIEATNIGELLQTILDFISYHSTSIIVLDGFEYLIVNNGFDTMLRLLQRVNDAVMQANSILVLPVNPNSLSSKELAIMSREMFVLESPLSFGMDMVEVEEHAE